MEKVSVVIEVEKNAKEIIDAAVGIIEHFVQKKPLAELMAKLPLVMVAVDDAQLGLAAAKTDNRDEILGYAVHKIAGIFDPSPSEPVAEPGDVPAEPAPAVEPDN